MQSVNGEESLELGVDFAVNLLNPLASKKSGDDPIFFWFSRYISARDAGRDAVNGTLGSLLDNSGNLMLNEIVIDSLRKQKGHDMAGYAPLRGINEFRELAIDLALGEYRKDIPASTLSIATPGGCGALYAAANNFADPGSKVLLRDLHWAPYQTILAENQLTSTSYPLWGSGLELQLALEELCQNQKRILSWINDPAHNPTGLTLTSQEREQTLNAFIDSANKNPNIGHTLLIDSAYHLYSEEPYSWARTISKLRDWPTNLLILFAISCSKSHTIYGMRTGAIVCLHPDQKFLQKLDEVILHTGRGTWSAAPRLPQVALAQIHAQYEDEWCDEKDTLKSILKARRKAFNEELDKVSLKALPNSDGYFAFIQCQNPEEVCESCAAEDVYLVPLKSGVRIGICAIPSDKMARVANALSNALR
ncbi:MAG: pyridoxal phosphate-dependent aminotransferase [Euryarchaeota archaeon]|nr:pyridoxal phosphate-dependent aminotransferase [Euryarchaeota archaeon]